jgi:GNAT superfamily N-acetyltransferase
LDLIIRRIDVSDSIAELTLLIRRAYKRLAEMGFNYTGSYQDEDVTRGRIADGECYVMVELGVMTGTITVYPPPVPWVSKDTWYARAGIATCGQFAVEPALQRSGRGSALMDVAELRARLLGARELALDTAEAAAHLVRFYTNRGYRFIEYIQHEGKTYRSAVFSKTL